MYPAYWELSFLTLPLMDINSGFQCSVDHNVKHGLYQPYHIIVSERLKSDHGVDEAVSQFLMK